MVLKTEFGLLDHSLQYFNNIFWQKDAILLTRDDRKSCMPLLKKCEEFKVVTKEESTLVIWHCLSLRTRDVHSQNKHLVFSLCQAVLAKKEKKKKTMKNLCSQVVVFWYSLNCSLFYHNVSGIFFVTHSFVNFLGMCDLSLIYVPSI